VRRLVLALVLACAGCSTVTGSPVPEQVRPADPLWTAPFIGKYSEETDLLGVWATDQLVVRGQHENIVAYRAGNGEVVWKLPQDDIHYCGMSANTANGLGVVMFGGPKPDTKGTYLCNQIQVIDVATGRPSWTKQSWDPADSLAPTEAGAKRPEISGDTVVVDVGLEIYGVELATGKVRWSYDKVQNNPVNKEQDRRKRGICSVSSWIVTPVRIAIEQSCGERAFEIGGEITVLTALDPLTGEKQWSTPVPTSIIAAGHGPTAAIATVVGADPPTLYLDRERSQDGSYALLPFDSATGQPGREIALPGPLDFHPGSYSDRAPRMIAQGTTLVGVLYGQEHSGCPAVRGVWAVDLVTGKALWDKPKALGCETSLVGLDGDAVLALSTGAVSPPEPAALYRVGLAGGTSRDTCSVWVTPSWWCPIRTKDVSTPWSPGVFRTEPNHPSGNRSCAKILQGDERRVAE
jgi:outer membrane protein assembly factor BamB